MKVHPMLVLIFALMASLACSLSTPVTDGEQAGVLAQAATPDHIEAENPTQTILASPTPVETTEPTCTVTADVLHLRTCAGLSCAVTDWLIRGETLTILVRSGDWLQVQTQAGQTGWVYSKYCGGQS
jgi:uncharacterized protein YgiM (DUF1202 family)